MPSWPQRFSESRRRAAQVRPGNAGASRPARAAERRSAPAGRPKASPKACGVFATAAGCGRCGAATFGQPGWQPLLPYLSGFLAGCGVDATLTEVWAPGLHPARVATEQSLLSVSLSRRPEAPRATQPSHDFRRRLPRRLDQRPGTGVWRRCSSPLGPHGRGVATSRRSRRAAGDASPVDSSGVDCRVPVERRALRPVGVSRKDQLDDEFAGCRPGVAAATSRVESDPAAKETPGPCGVTARHRDDAGQRDFGGVLAS